jgi:hypothetical protein
MSIAALFTSTMAILAAALRSARQRPWASAKTARSLYTLGLTPITSYSFAGS